nr:hypothetical protein [Tanacetum cinerariifolium]
MQTQTSNTLHNAIMEAGSKDSPPMLAPGNYVQRKSRIKRYIDTKPNHELIHHCLKIPPYKFTWADKEVSISEEWQRFVTLVKENQELKTVSYHKLYDILKQHQNENSSTRSQQAATRNRGKAIVHSPKPIHDQEPSVVAEDDETSKDKEIDKLMALISLSFKKIYKPTNNNLRTSSNTSRANQDNSSRINRSTGYENQRIGNVAGAREAVGSTVEFGHVARECQKPKLVKDAAYHREKMLLSHYMYMAQLQEVSSDAADSGPIFDTEPMQNVSTDDHYSVFAIDSEHPEQSESVHDTYLIEQDEHNVIIDSLDMSYDREQIDQNDDDVDLVHERQLFASLIEKLKCEIDDSKNRNKFLKTSNKVLIEKLKGEIEDFKNKSLESSNNHFKEENNKLFETNNLLSTDFKKSQAELARRNDVEYASKVEIDCAKARGDLISYKMESQKSFNKDTQTINDLNHTISEMKEKLCAHQETISILSQQKEAQIKLYKTREDQELDKVIALENKVKKAKQANPRLYDIGCYNDNLALMLSPESDEVIRIEKESRSKLSDLVRPFDYAKLNSLYDLFVPQREKSSEQRFFSERSRISHINAQKEEKKEFFSETNNFFGDMNGGIHFDSLTSQLETQKTQFVNEIDRLSREYYYADHVNAILGVYTELDEVTNLQFTAQTLHPNKKSIIKNTNVLALGMYKLHTESNQARTSQLPQDSRKTNKRVSFSTGVIPTTSVSRPQLKSNPIGDRVMRNNSQGKKQDVEDHHRNVKFSKNKTSVTACNDRLKAKTLNVNFVCATCDKCVLKEKHDMCVLKSVNGVNSRTKMPIVVPVSTRKPKCTVKQSVAKPIRKTVDSESNQKPRNITRKLYERLVEIVLFIVDSGCSKHMTGNLKLLINFVEKFIGTIKFGNDQIAPILRYGDLVQRAVTIKKGNDLLTGSRGTDLYLITLQDTNCPNLIYLMAKATSSQAWLWHRRLSHLNFDSINLLSKNDIVVGLPKLKFIKDHLCSSCELEKAKRKSFLTKITPSSKKRLQLLHMDLCGPIWVASINEKRYVLVIVDDYSRYTWTHFLRSKDETPEVLIDFLRLVQRGLQAQVRIVRTDKDTEFLNQTLHAYFAVEGIHHQTSVARTPKQNRVVERRNQTLVEAARTMLSAVKVPLFFWAEAIATTCFTQNRSLVIPRHEKTPYHIINDRKPSVKFFHIFGSLCYIVRDGENLDKMKEKGDACIFVRTVLDHGSLSPDTQCQENVTQADKIVTTSNELNLQFSPMFDELLNGSSKVVSKSSAVTTADAPNQQSIHVNFDELPQMASAHNSSDPAPTCPTMASVQISSDPAPECQKMALEHGSLSPGPHNSSDPAPSRQAKASVQISSDPAPTCQTMALEHGSLSPGRDCQENVSHGDKTDQGETSSHHVDSSNMHTFYQRYPSEQRWTKDHPLEQVIGNPSQSVRTRCQLESDAEICMFALT